MTNPSDLHHTLARLYREGFAGTPQLPGIEEEFAQAVLDCQADFASALSEYRSQPSAWLRGLYGEENMVRGDLLLGGLIHLLALLYDCEPLKRDPLPALAQRRAKPRSAYVHHVMPQQDLRSERRLSARRRSGLSDAFSQHVLRTNADLLIRFTETPVSGLFAENAACPALGSEALRRVCCELSMRAYALVKTTWRDQYAPDVSLDALCAWCCALACLSCGESPDEGHPAQEIAVVGAALACAWADAENFAVLRDTLASLRRLSGPLHALLREITSSLPGSGAAHIAPDSSGLIPFRAQFWLAELSAPSAVMSSLRAGSFMQDCAAAAASPALSPAAVILGAAAKGVSTAAAKAAKDSPHSKKAAKKAAVKPETPDK